MKTISLRSGHALATLCIVALPLVGCQHDAQPQGEGDGSSGTAGVDMVAPFGASLHVSGRDEAALDAALAPYRDRAGLVWHKSEPSLEDVFIELMSREGTPR